MEKLSRTVGETYNPEDADKIFLLGGTPKFRQPFAVRQRGKEEIKGNSSIFLKQKKCKNK